jgi:hypothetical protein
LIRTEPVNSWVSFDASPNLFEPDEKITEDEINVVFNSYVEILPPTFKLPSMFPSLPIVMLFRITAEPVTPKFFVVVKSVCTTKPLFGEITASAEPDFNLSISPIADAGMLNNCDPSPLKNDADTVPLTKREPDGTSTLDVIFKF